MLTKRDLKQIELVIDDRLDVKLDEKLDEKLKFLPTKKEFYDKMGEVSADLRKAREELELLPKKVSDHEGRITNLEDIHPNYQHS